MVAKEGIKHLSLYQQHLFIKILKKKAKETKFEVLQMKEIKFVKKFQTNFLSSYSS